MKSKFTFFIAVILCICISAAAFAEFDLSSMTVNELNELIIAAQNEILSKGGDVVIPNGKYAVGVDIAPGSYDFKFSDKSLMTATYIIRDVEGNVFDNGAMAYGTWVHLTLKDGQKLELQSPCFVRKGTRVGF